MARLAIIPPHIYATISAYLHICICIIIFQKWGVKGRLEYFQNFIPCGIWILPLCCWRGWGGSLGIRGRLVDCLTTRCQIYLVNPYVQTVHMYGKGAEGVLKAELRAAEVDLYFKKKTETAVSHKWKNDRVSQFRYLSPLGDNFEFFGPIFKYFVKETTKN